MADWSKPTILSNYVTFVDEVKARDVDAITLQATAVTAPPLYAVRLSRAPIKFQQWNGSAYQDLVLSPEGGGTGVTSIPALIPQLGLGSMAYQNANAVAISGGQVNSCTMINASMGGTGAYAGTGFYFNPYQYFTPVNIIGPPANWSLQITGDPGSAKSYGIIMSAGTVKDDTGLLVRNAAGTKYGLIIRGDMGAIFSTGLVVPLGPNAFVPA